MDDEPSSTRTELYNCRQQGCVEYCMVPSVVLKIRKSQQPVQLIKFFESHPWISSAVPKLDIHPHVEMEYKGGSDPVEYLIAAVSSNDDDDINFVSE
uniref:Uncharacterized protein n=1 Tax=Daphnia galeata TaxID=27404 RepID=A0A8J2S8V2_9CRUS|nr:unnamed protein product [Daphnia galeata]